LAAYAVSAGASNVNIILLLPTMPFMVNWTEGNSPCESQRKAHNNDVSERHDDVKHTVEPTRAAGDRSVGAKLRPFTVKVVPTEFGILVPAVGFVNAGASNENEIVDVPMAKLVATTA